VASRISPFAVTHFRRRPRREDARASQYLTTIASNRDDRAPEIMPGSEDPEVAGTGFSSRREMQGRR